MLKRFCDVCGKQIASDGKEFKDSETQYYVLLKKRGGSVSDADICNDCFHIVIDEVRKSRPMF